MLLMLSVSPCRAADLSADQVRAMLDAAGPDHPADLSGKSLEDLDLSNLDFKRANLSRANLFGAKLVGADFSGANLSGAKLDLQDNGFKFKALCQRDEEPLLLVPTAGWTARYALSV